jgi:drug/metabolite transporter (DMT)-like permease
MALSPEISALVWGLTSAVTWGAGDFCGGMASKRNNVYSVILVSQVVGALVMLGLAVWLEPTLPGPLYWLLGGLAGVAGMLGLVAFYTGLAGGRMGLVAPLSAVMTAILPVLVGIVLEGWPAATQIAGFGAALLAIWLLAWSGNARLAGRELGLAAVAGLGFGLFFILIDQVSDQAIFWPLLAARLASVSCLLVFMAARRQVTLPPASQLPLIAVTGILDVGGNAFFALASHMGRLDIASVFSSLYPASTVILAWLILKERLLKQQWLGVLAALAALVFIAW